LPALSYTRTREENESYFNIKISSYLLMKEYPFPIPTFGKPALYSRLLPGISSICVLKGMNPQKSPSSSICVDNGFLLN
jgi:hypothetical protein